MDQKNEKSQSFSFFRIDNTKLLVAILILVTVFMIDSQIGYIADFIPDQIVTPEGIALFVGIGVAFAVGGWIILSYIGQQNKNRKIKVLDLRITHTGASIAHYALILTIAIVIIQILAFGQYSIYDLHAAHYVSHGVWVVTLALLSRAFFAWYISSDKNKMVLVIALSMIFYVIEGGARLASDMTFLQLQPETIASDRVAFFPSFDLDATQQQTNLISQTVATASYILTWIGTVMLLRQYIHKIGKVKFYAILGSAMVYSLINYPLFVLGYFTPTEENETDVMNNILIFGIAGVLTGIIFGAAFLLVARTLQKNTPIRGYMMMAAYGFILFYVAGSATAAQAAYPPFGLASVAFTGMSCYMIYAALYSAAVTVSQDSALRGVIRKSVMEQSKLLDSIGTAQMVKEVEALTSSVSKKAAKMGEESGVQPSMTNEDIRDYMEFVMEELKGKR